jgi:hypothetical protein
MACQSARQLRLEAGARRFRRREPVRQVLHLPTGGAYTGQGTTMTNPALPNYPQWGTAVPGMGRSIYAGLNVKF